MEAAAVAMPELMGQLTREFHSIHGGAGVATERTGQIKRAHQAATPSAAQAADSTSDQERDRSHW